MRRRDEQATKVRYTWRCRPSAPCRCHHPNTLAWHAGIGALAVCGIIEWPIAGMLAVGKALADNRHSKALQEFGDALDQAG